MVFLSTLNYDARSTTHQIRFACLSAPINVIAISFHALSVSLLPAAAAAAAAVCSKISSRLETSFLVRNTASPATTNKFCWCCCCCRLGQRELSLVLHHVMRKWHSLTVSCTIADHIVSPVYKTNHYRSNRTKEWGRFVPQPRHAQLVPSYAVVSDISYYFEFETHPSFKMGVSRKLVFQADAFRCP